MDRLILGTGVLAMNNKRHKPEEIITKLLQVGVLRGQGMLDVARQPGASELTYHS